MVQRRSAVSWLTNLEAQFRMASGFMQGLLMFQMPAAAENLSWQQWPFMAIPMDLGPDGVAGLHAAQYHWKLAIEGLPDPSHGCNCDTDNALSLAGLKPVVMLGAIVANVPHGPDKEGLRHTQIADNMQQYLDNNSPASAVLFQSVKTHLAANYRKRGYDLGDASQEDEHMWTLLRARAASRRMGNKISLARFMDSLSMAQHQTDEWWELWLERTVCALEEDFLHGKNLDAHVVTPTAAETMTEEGPNTSSIVNMEAKLARKLVDGALGLSVFFTQTALRTGCFAS